jgi:histidinol-phosphate aminotransferase
MSPARPQGEADNPVCPPFRPANLVRPLVQNLTPYVPGEQPKISGLVKLNTNENPYPPSPHVLAAVRRAVDGRLRLYPSPTAESLREALAGFHGCRVENIIVGNGSDELLALATRAFVEPSASSSRPSPLKGRGPSPGIPGSSARFGQNVIQYFTPSYSLYPILADIHGSRRNAVPLAADFQLPSVGSRRSPELWDIHAALSYVTTPNAPTGVGYSTEALAELCARTKGVVILDEAYVDFAEENALELALTLPNVLVARTFSKAYSLCFQRVGYFVGPPEIIAALHKIRDSYNVNGLGQVAALATLADLPFYRKNFEKIRRTRARLSGELTQQGFSVTPSQANFIFVRPPALPAREWLQKLRDRAILVRWFDQPRINEYLRVSIGTDAEAGALIAACRELAPVLPVP